MKVGKICEAVENNKYNVILTDYTTLEKIEKVVVADDRGEAVKNFFNTCPDCYSRLIGDKSVKLEVIPEVVNDDIVYDYDEFDRYNRAVNNGSLGSYVKMESLQERENLVDLIMAVVNRLYDPNPEEQGYYDDAVDYIADVLDCATFEDVSEVEDELKNATDEELNCIYSYLEAHYSSIVDFYILN